LILSFGLNKEHTRENCVKNIPTDEHVNSVVQSLYYSLEFLQILST